MPETAAAFARPALELVNTRRPDGRDDLDDDAWLAAALDRWELAPAEPVATAEREALRGLRDTLRALVERVAAGGTLSAGELAEVNALLGRVPVRAELVAIAPQRYAVDMAPVAGEWIEMARRELAGSFGALLVRGEPGRLKLCADETCRRAFYDTSKSRTRRWCDPATCGNRVRVRRHRARAAPG